MFEHKYDKYWKMNGGIKPSDYNVLAHEIKYKILLYSINSIKDAVILSRYTYDIGIDMYERLEEHPIIKDFVLRVCPPTPQQLEKFKHMSAVKPEEQSENYPYKYFSIAMENLNQVMTFRKQLGSCEPKNWSTPITPLQDFTQLNQWSNIDLNEDYKIVRIRDDFASFCQSLTQIDLRRLTNLTEIGNSFACYTTNLTQIDLHGLTNLTTIGNFFAHYTNLTQIDLHGLTNLTTIGNNFANKCIRLTQINLSGLTNLTTIGNFFACTVMDRFSSEIKSLTKIDLSGLTNLTKIGSDFAENWTSLTRIDLSGLTNLTTIGDRFAFQCTSLTQIDLSELTNLTTIGYGFIGHIFFSNSRIYKHSVLERIIMTNSQKHLSQKMQRNVPIQYIN